MASGKASGHRQI